MRRPEAIAAIAGAIRRSARQRSLRRRYRRVMLPLAAAAVVLLGLGAAWRLLDVPHAEQLTRQESPVVLVRGSVMVADGTAETRVDSTASGQSLSRGALIRTTRAAGATLSVGHRTRVDVAPATQVRVDPSSETTRMHVAEGRVDLDVDPTQPGDRVFVDTPHATVVVVGTRFRVDVSGATAESSTTVSVRRGVVLVYRGDERVARLERGETWSSAPAAESRTTDPKRANNDAARLARDAAQATPDADSSPAAGPRRGVAPTGSLLGEANALFQQAIDARNQGDDETAARLFSEFASRFSGSPLAQEARIEELRALGRQGNTNEATKVARRYLAEHPEGVARREAGRLVLEGPAAMPDPGAAEQPDHVGAFPTD